MSMKANALNLMTIYRGSIVSISYCLTCHGVNADGKGPRRKIVCPGACQPATFASARTTLRTKK